MKVVVHPADKNGCGTYRMILPAQALAAQGHDVTIAFDYTYQARWQPSAWGDRIIEIVEEVDADVVVLQRPLKRTLVELIDALQDRGVAVVVEIDDDFHSIHPRNPAWKNSNPLTDRDRNREWLKKACARADLVTVSTSALAKRYGAHERVAVLPNCVPDWYTRLSPGSYTAENLPRPEGVLVGWSGSVVTHPDDLDATGGALAEIDCGFHVIGTGLRVKDALGLKVEPTATGWLPIEAYPEGLMQLDVGIVPLAAHEFNEAKSYLKGLEYAAVGVPFVASPTGEYRKLAREGIGWTADSPAEWRWLVEELVKDTAHRRALSVAYREQVRDQFTIEKNAHRWWEAWEFAYENRTERAAA